MTATHPRLTPTQRKVLVAIVRHVADHGRCPTIRELMPVVPTSSPNGVLCHLSALRKKGLVSAPPKGPGGECITRGIEVPGLTAALKAAAKRYLADLEGAPT